MDSWNSCPCRRSSTNSSCSSSSSELEAFVTANELGIVVISGYKVRLRARKYREPDILFIKAAHRSGIKKQYCEKADLVIEVVSEKNRPHDIKKKRIEYAKAGIPEYWIIDPEETADHGPGAQIKAKDLHRVRHVSQGHSRRVEAASRFHGRRDNRPFAEALTGRCRTRLTVREAF